MNEVTIDRAMRDKLCGLNQQTLLCDEEGRLLGLFLPAEAFREMARSLEIPFTEEEMEQMRQQKGGRSLADIWKSLGRT